MRASPSRGRQGSPAPKGRRLVRRVFLAGFAVVFAWLWFVWPPPVWYRWTWPGQTAFMAMRRGQETAASPRAEQNGALPKRLYRPVSREQIAPVMRSAALVAEDHRFYQHAGIDYQEIREALGYRRDEFRWTNPKDRAELGRVLGRAWARRSRIRGASTITQQLAKNLYLSPSRNPLRKVKEALTAWRLEYWLGKERILELYLNVVELGPEVWGVEAASQKYFGHPARRLSLDEAAALAGTLPFPLKSNPGYHPGRMHWRQSMIVRRIRGEVIEIPRDTADLPDSVRADTTGRE
jgi:monofunctional biosynthetic peptidoglycan transglycosylase